MELGIHIPHRHDSPLQPYLEALGSRVWDGAELPGDTLQDTSDWEDLLEAFSVDCLGLDSLLPESVTRHMPETTDGARTKLLGHLKTQLARAAMLNIRYIVLDLGIDRIPGARFEPELDARIALLRSLMALAEAHEITVCLPVRLPVPPFNPRLFDQSARLVNEVMHPNCRLALNVVPDELPPDFNIKGLLKDFCVHIALVRFHYEPTLGIPFDAPTQTAWSRALRWQGFRGTVIFSPQVEGPTMFRYEVERLAPMLDEIWRGLPADA